MMVRQTERSSNWSLGGISRQPQTLARILGIQLRPYMAKELLGTGPKGLQFVDRGLKTPESVVRGL